MISVGLNKNSCERALKILKIGFFFVAVAQLGPEILPLAHSCPWKSLTFQGFCPCVGLYLTFYHIIEPLPVSRGHAFSEDVLVFPVR